MKSWIPLACLLCVVGAGCKGGPIVLYDMQGDQHQWVWPCFVDQPMVLAFWDVDVVQCIEDLDGLNTLAMRGSPVELVGVCTSSDRLRINRWMRDRQVRFTVIHDPDKKLARRLGVTSCPTYVFFDLNGNEIGRSLTIRTIHNWFDRPRHLRRATGDS